MDKPKLEALRFDGIDYSVEYHDAEDAHGVCLTVVWEDWGFGIFEPAVALAFAQPKRFATESEIYLALAEYHNTRPATAQFALRSRRSLAVSE